MGIAFQRGIREMTWNKDKAMGFVRHVMTALGPIVAYLGWVDEATWAMAVGPVLTVAGFLWSWLAPEKQHA